MKAKPRTSSSRQSNQPRATRNPDVNNQIRKLATEGDAQRIERALLETRDFLRSNRIYGVGRAGIPSGEADIARRQTVRSRKNGRDRTGQ